MEWKISRAVCVWQRGRERARESKAGVKSKTISKTHFCVFLSADLSFDDFRRSVSAPRKHTHKHSHGYGWTWLRPSLGHTHKKRETNREWRKQTWKKRHQHHLFSLVLSACCWQDVYAHLSFEFFQILYSIYLILSKLLCERTYNIRVGVMHGSYAFRWYVRLLVIFVYSLALSFVHRCALLHHFPHAFCMRKNIVRIRTTTQHDWTHWVNYGECRRISEQLQLSTFH